MNDILTWLKDFFAWPPTLVEYIIGGLIVATFLYQLYYYIRYMAGINRRLRRLRKGKVQQSAQQPPVSVIICARNEEENLQKFIPLLLQQDYPEYEIIVVDDSSEDHTRDYIQSMSVKNERMRFTFVPKGYYQFSTKKLAITLGIKAARYEHLLFTDADCYPADKSWIANMMKGFTPNTDIVLGLGAYEIQPTHINRLISYDTLWNGMQYLGQALSHHPYMGVGRNMAYTKSLFFGSKGFSQHIHLLAGDDDLFVNHVATRKNTNVVIEPKALTWSIPKTTLSDWWSQKKRHLGVSSHYRFATKLRLLGEPLSRGLFYAGIIAACCLCRPYIWACALVLFVARFICQLTMINVTAGKLGLAKYHINLLWFDIILPLINLWMIIVCKFSHPRHNMW